jgi:hypothetical protein
MVLAIKNKKTDDYTPNVRFGEVVMATAVVRAGNPEKRGTNRGGL